MVLGVLRAPDGKSEAAPQPRIADAGDLVQRMTSAGTDVRMTVTGQRRPLPGSVGLCGYRVVQEALTNAGRHALGSQVRVELGYQDDALRITIRDDGSTVRPATANPGSAWWACGSGWRCSAGSSMRGRTTQAGSAFPRCCPLHLTDRGTCPDDRPRSAAAPGRRRPGRGQARFHSAAGLPG
jgi:hypothetical protein